MQKCKDNIPNFLELIEAMKTGNCVRDPRTHLSPDK